MLRGISDIRAFFRTNRTPVYFVSPTAFDLLGLDCWLRTFFYVNDFDSFEGGHLPAELRHRLDSKIVTTRLGNQVGSRARRTRSGGPRPTTSRALAGSAGLVVQTPYGDSGETTFFIRGQRDRDEHASDKAGQELEVMKRINNRAAAVEAVLTATARSSARS